MDDAVEAILATGRLPRERGCGASSPERAARRGLVDIQAKNTRPGERAYLSHSPATGGNCPLEVTLLLRSCNGAAEGIRSVPRGYVRQSEDRLCEPQFSAYKGPA